MKKEINPRLGRVGGEAVLEGVMMRAGNLLATACRKEDGSIVVKEKTFTSLRKKHRLCNLPILRGIISFAESMVMSYGCLMDSAEVMGAVEEETRFEKWFKKHLGIGFFNVLMVVAAVLGVALALTLFLVLPREAARLIEMIFNTSLGNWKSLVEGAVKIVIFVLYLYLVSLMKDIRRTFQYHGAEHKSVACYEAGEELTVENARKHTRFHPRCGTSFMFVMILLGVLLGFAVNALFPNLHTLAYAGIRLLLLPLIVGLGYEFILYAGRHNNILTRTLSAPGLLMQRITTREPDDDQLEVALLAIRYALADELPDFDRNAYRYRAPETTVSETEAEAPSSETVAAGEAVEELEAVEADSAEAALSSEEVQASLENPAPPEQDADGE